MEPYNNNITSVGGAELTTTSGGGYWLNGIWYPYDTYPQAQPVYQHYWHVPVEPTTCIGKAHVFECDHVPTCKCGAIKRVMPKAKKAK